MVGRWAASQIASASAMSFFWPLDERLHVGRRDQPHLVAELADRASPVMRTRAGLHGDKAAGLARKERQYLLAPELLAEHDSAGQPGAVRLEHVLGQIKADGANLFHGRLPQVVLKHHHLGTSMPSGGVHPITGRRSPSSPPCAPTASMRPGSSTARSTASSSRST